MVREGCNFILLQVCIQFCHCHLWKRLFFSPVHFKNIFVKNKLLQLYGFIFGFSIIIQWCWCTCLFLCWQNTVLNTMALQDGLKSGTMKSPDMLFLLRIILDICGRLCSHMNFGIFFPTHEECHWNSDADPIESVDYFCQYMAIFTMLTQEHGRSLHCVRSSSISIFST